MKSYYEWGKDRLVKLVRGPNGELCESVSGMAREEKKAERKTKTSKKGKNNQRVTRCLLWRQKNMAVEGGKSPMIIGLYFNILKLPIIGPILRRILGGGIT
jgi:hypothetical protein